MNQLENEKLEIVYNLSVSLSLITDTIESLSQAKACLRRLVTCDVLLVFINDQERECLIAPNAYNELADFGQNELSISYDHAVVKDLMISKQSAWSRLPEAPIVPAMARELFVPLLSPEGTLGCLYFAKSVTTPFTVQEITWAKLSAHLLSLPLERAQWTQKYSQTQKQVERWHESYLLLLESFPFPTAIVDLTNDKIVEANGEFIKILVYDHRALLDRGFSAICADVVGLLQATSKDEIGGRITELVSADGERVKGLVKWAPMMLNDQPRHIITFLPNVSTMVEGNRESFQELNRKVEALESFVTAVSHDLKVPIQNLRSYTTFLAEDYRANSPKGAQDYLKRILANLDQMEQLMTGLLNFYRADRPDTTFEYVSAADLVEGVLTNLSDLLRRYEAKIIFERELPFIYCNKSAMAQVFVNLISNSLKYARKPHPPEIEIGSSKIDSGYEFFVKDSGIGVDAKDQERIFEPFYSLQREHDSTSTGVGLAVVKKIVEMHDGTIWVEPNPAGGAIFKFVLPTRREAC